MSDFLVAYFHTEVEANASAEKLLAHGIHQDQLTLYPEREANTSPIDDALSALSSVAPVTLAEIVNPIPEMISGPSAEAPPLAGSATLTVVLTDPVSVNDVCSVLKDSGAYLIDVTEKNVTQEYPDM